MLVDTGEVIAALADVFSPFEVWSPPKERLNAIASQLKMSLKLHKKRQNLQGTNMKET